MEQVISKGRPDGITLLSALFWILAIIAIIGSLFMLGAKDAIIDIIEEDSDTPNWVIDLVDSIFVGIGVISFIIGIIYVIVGWGLWTMKSWARLAAIVLAVISLISFPIGTILGIIILWYLFKPEIKEAFHK